MIVKSPKRKKKNLAATGGDATGGDATDGDAESENEQQGNTHASLPLIERGEARGETRGETRGDIDETRGEIVEFKGDVTPTELMMHRRRKRMFYSQLFISIMVVIWLLWQLSVVVDSSHQIVLFSTLTAIIGFWLPSPSP